MRISDWSSDVCSSDLLVADVVAGEVAAPGQQTAGDGQDDGGEEAGADQEVVDPPPGDRDRLVDRGRRRHRGALLEHRHLVTFFCLGLDRKSVVEGKSVSVRLDLGGRRIIKKKNK